TADRNDHANDSRCRPRVAGTGKPIGPALRAYSAGVTGSVCSAPQKGIERGDGRRSRWLAVVALGGVVALALALFPRAGSAARFSSDAPAAARAGGQSECPPVHGPQWVFPSTTLKAT